MTKVPGMRTPEPQPKLAEGTWPPTAMYHADTSPQPGATFYLSNLAAVSSVPNQRLILELLSMMQTTTHSVS